jgi:hypothetical protein
VRGSLCELIFLVALAETDPSSVADFVCDTFSHKGRRERQSL